MAVTLLMTGYYRHPKMMAANAISGGELAEVLWARGLDYVNEHGTDGFIPTGMPVMLCPTKTTARVKGLVTAGLWDLVEGGWRVHDYDDWNLRASERAKADKEKSEARSRAGKKGAAVRWGGGRVARPDDNGHGKADGKPHGNAVANGWQSDNPGPGPGPGPGSLGEVEREVEVPAGELAEVRGILGRVPWLDPADVDALPGQAS